MRVKLTVSYDGTNYCGWQKQPNVISVQEIIENAINVLTGEKVKLVGSGRTDAGVHALGQVAHFDTKSTIPAENFKRALNTVLPSDIKITLSEGVSDTFHACNGAKKKTYTYTFYKSESELPLIDRYSLMIPQKTDVNLMKETAKLFVGTHDFNGFKASKSGAKTSVRTIYLSELTEKDGKLIFTVCGNGFLYNMVRIMAGAMLAVGLKNLQLKDVFEMIEKGKRNVMAKTVSSKGLCLESVEYL